VGNPLYRDFEKLVTITIMGKKFQVPEKNICLRAFQYVSPETIPYGRFCWNQECQLCRVVYTMEGQENLPPRPILACKVLVAEGMQIVELSDELRWNLSGVLNPAEPSAPVADHELDL
jgi:NADH dehydrogenase/NADH:ubiquinone oxidoreductase subunit G